MGMIKEAKIDLMNGETYHYRYVEGGQKTLVLVHGQLASSYFYEEMMMKLKEDYTVYALDLRGFGESTYRLPVDDLREFASDLKLFTDALGLKSFELAGWSTGGAISMLYAAMYPEDVLRLILISAVGSYGYPQTAQNEDGSVRLLKSKDEVANERGKVILQKALAHKELATYQKIWETQIYNFSKPSKEVFDRQMAECFKQKNLIDVYYVLSKHNMSDAFNGQVMGTGEAKRLMMPVLMIHGISDRVIPFEEAQKTRNLIGSNATLYALERCGHSPFVDGLDTMVALIRA